LNAGSSVKNIPVFRCAVHVFPSSLIAKGLLAVRGESFGGEAR
jgi:hypothetical protein